MLKVWGRRSSFNVQKVLWLIGELELAHEHVDAGGNFGGLDLPAGLLMTVIRRVGKGAERSAHHSPDQSDRPACCDEWWARRKSAFAHPTGFAKSAFTSPSRVRRR
jgi:hypothetical protein